MAVEIGALRALLSLDSAAFEKGVKRAQASMSGMQRSFSRASEKLGSVGRAMSTRVTAPVVGAMGLIARSAVNNAVEIERLAQVANASATSFQRFAAGASTVGIEQDKLADILKDVNDRVGDFLTTGAGPMADFFENIAPQVGVTADQFKNLSGPEALQLYVSSLEKAGVGQQEMTFYMEAMASDATALIPLLRQNGKEMDRLGDSAEKAGAIMDDTTIAALLDAKSAMREAGNAIKGLVNQIMAALAPALVAVSEKLRDASAWFSGLSPKMKQVIGITAAVAAAIGPLAITLGFLATGLAALASPIGLVVMAFGAVAGAVAYVVTQWDTLTQKYPSLQSALEIVGAVASEVWRIFSNTGKAAFDIAIEYVDYFAAMMRLDFAEALQSARAISEIFVNYISDTFPGVIDTISRVVESAVTAGKSIIDAVRAGIVDGIAGVKSAIDALVDSVIGWIKEIPGRVADAARNAGRDIVGALKQGFAGASALDANGPLGQMRGVGANMGQGLAQGIGDAKEAIDAAAAAAVNSAEEAAREASETRSPSRVWMRIGSDLMSGLGAGIADNAQAAAAAASDAANQVTSAANDNLDGSSLTSAFDSIGNAVSGAITGAQSFGDAMAGVFQQIATQWISSGVSDILSALFGGGSASGGSGGSIFGTLLSSIFGGFRANGGGVSPSKAYVVGERGPEIFSPSGAGTIIPNSQAGRAMPNGPAVNMNFKTENTLSGLVNFTQERTPSGVVQRIEAGEQLERTMNRGKAKSSPRLNRMPMARR